MSHWPVFWHVVVWASLIGYFGLAVVISIGGFLDVGKMFSRLRREKGQQP